MVACQMDDFLPDDVRAQDGDTREKMRQTLSVKYHSIDKESLEKEG